MAVLSRNEIDSKYKWDLTRLFATDEEWEKEFAAIDGLAAEFSKRAGTLTSKEQVLEAFRAHAEILRRFEFLATYAMAKQNEDASVPLYQAMDDRTMSLGSRVVASAAFMTP